MTIQGAVPVLLMPFDDAGEIDDDGPPVDDVVKVPASHERRVGEHHLRLRKGTLEDGSGTEPVEVRIRHDAMNLRKRALFHA